MGFVKQAKQAMKDNGLTHDNINIYTIFFMYKCSTPFFLLASRLHRIGMRIGLLLVAAVWAGSVFGQYSPDSSRVGADSLVRVSKDVEVYRIRPAVDIPLTAIGTGWSLYAFTRIYSKDPSTDAQINALRPEDVSRFNRGGIRPYSEKADKDSYIPFYGAMPLPILFLADKKMRKDFWKLNLLYLEAMSVTGMLYTGSVYMKDSYRPYAYSAETPMDYRKRGGAKNNFYAGHVALVATSTFFMAKTYNDYHPDSKLRWVFFGVAGAATGITAYGRYRGGLHFPSDIILGTVQGTLAGILVPHFHKNKILKNRDLMLYPFSGESHGLAAVYKF